MQETIDSLILEENRLREFPVTQKQIFLAHAAVAALPRVAADALMDFAKRGSLASQEDKAIWPVVQQARETAARLLGCSADEIALLGPTAMGLNLVAHGLPWQPGDEVVFYHDDYPANVYPWKSLAGRGVIPRPLSPEHLGVITWELVEQSLTPRTRLVALASCHFLSGYRLDVNTIGKELQQRGIWFCLDGIQSLGAFPLDVTYVDFLSADSHKWLLGPCGAGIFYVRRSLQSLLRPTLLGSWNVVSPDFSAQEEIAFYAGARRYEPGTLNLPGIAGMHAAMHLLLRLGIPAIAQRILALCAFLEKGLRNLGYERCLEEFYTRRDPTDADRSGIVSVRHPRKDLSEVAERLQAHAVSFSLRRNRARETFLRFSPHFYNTEDELSQVLEILA